MSKVDADANAEREREGTAEHTHVVEKNGEDMERQCGTGQAAGDLSWRSEKQRTAEKLGTEMAVISELQNTLANKRRPHCLQYQLIELQYTLIYDTCKPLVGHCCPSEEFTTLLMQCNVMGNNTSIVSYLVRYWNDL